MVLLYTAWKNFRKSIVMNLMAILQTTASLIAVIIMVSTLSIVYRCYNPFQDYFQSKGLLVRFENSFYGAHTKPTTDSQGRLIFDILESTQELEPYLNGNVESILACRGPITEVSLLGIPAVSYEDEMLKRYQPDLAEGRWLKPGNEEVELEVVISENEYGWKVGDLIDMEFLSEEGTIPVSARVVGKIREGARVLGFNLNGNQDQNFLLCYQTYRYDIEKEPIFLFSNSALERLEPRPLLALCYTTLIRYQPDTPDAVIEEDRQTLSSMGAFGAVNMEKAERESRKYITQQLMKLMPIVIVLLILLIISSISCSALAVKRRIHDYAIYYTVGLTWKRTLLVNVFQSVLICLISSVLAATALILFSHSGLQESFHITWNKETALAIAGVILLQLLTSLIIPLQQLYHTTPKSVLTDERK